MPEPTVEQVLNIDKQPVQKPSVLGPIVAFFLLPPLGVYLLWKEKSFHSNLALLTMILGLGYLLSIPALFLISNEFLLIFTAFCISAVQVIYSFYLYRRVKRRGYLETSELTILAVFVLLVDILVLPLLLGWLVIEIIKPLFQQTIDQYKNFPT